MSDWPLVMILLITYKRTDLAVRVIQALQRNLIYPFLDFVIADDGSPDGHVNTLKGAIGKEVVSVNAQRKGVGHSMNLGMAECLRRSDYILWLEDDWECYLPFDLRPCVQILAEKPEIGMVRLGYLSPELDAEVITAADHLWWRLRKGPTYTFTGHASLRHKRFCEAYGEYQLGLAPGETELSMCGTVNKKDGPLIVIPAWTGEYGAFAHIGSESYKDSLPGK